MWRIDVENEVNASQRMVLRDNPPVAVTPVFDFTDRHLFYGEGVLPSDSGEGG